MLCAHIVATKKVKKMIKTYRDLQGLTSFIDRYRYLKIGGLVGQSTFGFDRCFNQRLYTSKEWQRTRNQVILRDNGCDLGIPSREIFDRILIHHINPISIEDIENSNPVIFDLDNLICTTHNTHNAIHFGDDSLLIGLPKERRKGDTVLWKVF